MSDIPRRCPVCESLDVTTLGPILHPNPALVAGVPIALGNTAYRLQRCGQCGFQFKDPPIDSEHLLNCYAEAKPDNWELDPDPWQRKFDVLRDVLTTHSRGRRVLDIGCFNGALLKFLGDGWDKFGVEPSSAAAELARQRGVKIVAANLEEWPSGLGPFDAVLAVDVVEHIVDPLPFYRQAGQLLAPGGIFVVMTGDTASLAWRLQRGAYWYCSLPEHVSFFNRTSLDAMAKEIGLACAEYRHLRPRRIGLRSWLNGTMKSAIYVVGNRLQGFGLRPLRRLFVERRGPTIQSAKDHLIYVFRKA